jgi:parallel beta-helix repeat protein
MRRAAHVGWVAIALIALDAAAVRAESSSAPLVHTSWASPSSSPSSPLNHPDMVTTLLFVNPTVGNDALGDGSQRSPWKTLTHALEQAQPGTVIMLSPGTYSAESGEQFPILLPDGVTVQGDLGRQGAGVLIRGGGEFLSPTVARQNVAIVAADNTTLTGVTVRNPAVRGYGLWIESSNARVMHNTFSQNGHDGVSVTGASAPLIQSNQFHRNGASGISIFGSGQADIRDNVFEATGFGINVGEYAAPRIINNRIVNNRDGVVIQGQARPVLRDNLIEGSQRDGIVAIADAVANLGTADSPGHNQFHLNGRYALNAREANHPIPVFGNELIQADAIGQVDFTGRAAIPAPVAVSLERGQALLAESRAAASPQPTAQLSPPPSRTQSAPISTPAPTPILTSSAAAIVPISQSERSPAANPVEPIAAPTATPINEPAAPPANTEETSPQPVHEIAVIPARTAPSVSAAAFPRPTDMQSTRESTRGDRSTPIPSISEFLPPPPTAPASAASPQVASVAPARPNQAAIRPASAPAPRTRPHLTGPVEIPVPPPVSYASASTPAVRPASQPTTPARTSRPVTQASAQAPTRARNLLQALVPRPTTPSATPSAPRSNVLPVPTGSIPTGHVGNLPTVTVYSDPLRRTAASPSPSTQINRASLSGLRYRVIVDAPNERSQSQVRSLVPGAFRMLVNGYPVMQVGAFSNLANANEAAQMLSNYGFRVAVQQME